MKERCYGIRIIAIQALMKNNIKQGFHLLTFCARVEWMVDRASSI
jgi:hypothetical protein